MLMHLSLGHVTLPPGEFSSSEIFSQWDLKPPGGLTLDFAPNFSFVLFSHLPLHLCSDSDIRHR